MWHLMFTLCLEASWSRDTGRAAEFGFTENQILAIRNYQVLFEDAHHILHSLQIHLNCNLFCLQPLFEKRTGFTFLLYPTSKLCQVKRSQHYLDLSLSNFHYGTLSHRASQQQPRWSCSRGPFRQHRCRQRSQRPNEKGEIHERQIRVRC
jgi:hypothetical protein